MTADIIMFVPRSNPNAARAFWIGQTETEQRAAILGIQAGDAILKAALSGEGFPFSDSAPAEYNYQAPTDDPA